MKIKQTDSTVVVIDQKDAKRTKKVKYLLISDLHWDNPKCNRELLKKDLDQAVKEDCPIFINGDLFCVMQGHGDPRKSKSDIRPEHNSSRYLDKIVETAVEWFGPYAEHIALIGYGNHETKIIKFQETDILDRFISGMNLIHKPKNHIIKGGYGGWIKTQFKGCIHQIKYYHGTGGGGPVTGGAIRHNRMQTMYHGADLVWQGHIHESEERSYQKEEVDTQHKVRLKDILAVTTPTYKEEYAKGEKGWHVERGAPAKVLGGRWLELEFHRPNDKPCYIIQKTYKTDYNPSIEYNFNI